MLIVDEEEISRDDFQEVLKKCGCTVISTAAAKYDVLVIDNVTRAWEEMAT